MRGRVGRLRRQQVPQHCFRAGKILLLRRHVDGSGEGFIRSWIQGQGLLELRACFGISLLTLEQSSHCEVGFGVAGAKLYYLTVGSEGRIWFACLQNMSEREPSARAPFLHLCRGFELGGGRARARLALSRSCSEGKQTKIGRAHV